MNARWERRWLVCVGVGMAMGAGVARPVAAALTIDHGPVLDGCTEAASYTEDDQSAEATRARRRCRLENFDRKLAFERDKKLAQQNAGQTEAIQIWMQREQIPARVMHRNSIDLFASGAMISYGLAGGWLVWPNLEIELWIGRGSGTSYDPLGTLTDSRTCAGGRTKWLMARRSNLTPFLSAGVAGCRAAVQFYRYQSGPLPPGGIGSNVGPAATPNGDATAHDATVAAGLTWMDNSGFHLSFEYGYSYAFYTQAQRDEPLRPQDADMRGAWQRQLAADRRGVRAQVGYAF
jgi:hypothetical protein